jgi:hypothetical protein
MRNTIRWSKWVLLMGCSPRPAYETWEFSGPAWTHGLCITGVTPSDCDFVEKLSRWLLPVLKFEKHRIKLLLSVVASLKVRVSTQLLTIREIYPILLSKIVGIFKIMEYWTSRKSEEFIYQIMENCGNQIRKCEV